MVIKTTNCELLKYLLTTLYGYIITEVALQTLMLIVKC